MSARTVGAFVLAAALRPCSALAQGADAGAVVAPPAAPEPVVPADAAVPANPAAEPGTTPAAAASEPATRPRRARRRRRRRRRRGRLPRARGPLMSVGWRFTQIPTEGGGGATHAVGVTLQPLARTRSYVRLALGAELALRSAPREHTDPLVWFTASLGAQLPGRVVTPFAAVAFYGGLAARNRFFRTMFEGAYTVGLEAGADARLAGFAGVGAAVGVGRTVVGEQYSYGAWVRASVALW